jgi:hypothetical protein
MAQRAPPPRLPYRSANRCNGIASCASPPAAIRHSVTPGRRYRRRRAIRPASPRRSPAGYRACPGLRHGHPSAPQCGRRGAAHQHARQHHREAAALLAVAQTPDPLDTAHRARRALVAGHRPSPRGARRGRLVPLTHQRGWIAASRMDAPSRCGRTHVPSGRERGDRGGRGGRMAAAAARPGRRGPLLRQPELLCMHREEAPVAHRPRQWSRLVNLPSAAPGFVRRSWPAAEQARDRGPWR